jgi:hypothetical protein
MKEQEDSKADCVERRDHFRVMDALPVIIRKLEALPEPMRAKILRGFVPEHEIQVSTETLDALGGISSDLRRILERMETKINQILEKLQIPTEDIPCTPEQPVCLSATGIRFKAANGFNLNDLVEIKLRITLQAPTWLLLYGQITRMVPGDDGGIETAVAFFELSEEIREMLIRYTLQKQREMIRKERGYSD